MRKNLIIIFGFILLVFAILLLINPVEDNLDNKENASQAKISGETDSKFLAETVSTSKTIEYIFTPKTKEEKNYILSYELKENENLIDSRDRELVTKISKENPIIFSIERDTESEYSLKTNIYDAEDPTIKLHNDQIIIYSQQKEELNSN